MISSTTMIDSTINDQHTSSDPLASNSNENERFCKICFESDADNDEWLHPCRCSGTIKWVHRNCLIVWLDNAPFQQRAQCTMCKYYYRACWHLKPLSRWTWPNVRLLFRGSLAILFDVWIAYRCVRHISALIQGTANSVVRSLAYIAFWGFIKVNRRRIEFYKRLGLMTISPFIEFTIQNAV